MDNFTAIFFKFCMVVTVSTSPVVGELCIGPQWPSLVYNIKCFKICEVKSNLWLQCDKLSKSDIVSRIKGRQHQLC